MEIEVLRHTERDDESEKQTMYLVGGIALLIAGTGLLLSNSKVRAYMSELGLGKYLAAAIPDLERYLRLRSM